MLSIRLESAGDTPAVEALFDRTLGRERQRRPVYRWRRAIPPIAALCHLAREDDALLAAARVWPIALRGGREVRLGLFGPIAVATERQGTGIGGRLLRHTVVAAHAFGLDALVLVGDPAYYERHGWQPAAAFGLAAPLDLGRPLLAFELRPGGLDGGGCLRRPAVGAYRPSRCQASIDRPTSSSMVIRVGASEVRSTPITR